MYQAKFTLQPASPRAMSTHLYQHQRWRSTTTTTQASQARLLPDRTARMRRSKSTSHSGRNHSAESEMRGSSWIRWTCRYDPESSRKSRYCDTGFEFERKNSTHRLSRLYVFPRKSLGLERRRVSVYLACSRRCSRCTFPVDVYSSAHAFLR